MRSSREDSRSVYVLMPVLSRESSGVIFEESCNHLLGGWLCTDSFARFGAISQAAHQVARGPARKLLHWRGVASILY